MPDDAKITALNSVDDPVKRVLCLGYDRQQTRIIDALIDAKCEVHHTQDRLARVHYDLIVSFGYRHILKKDFIDNVGCPVFNLHIAYLPYNRGAHPNFWSFYENTPPGVTIHLIDDGIDTGPVVFQKYVNFDDSEITFSQTYARLIDEIESLFITRLDDILADRWHAKPQRGKGTLHYAKDLPDEFSGWDAVIEDEVRRLDASMVKD